MYVGYTTIHKSNETTEAAQNGCTQDTYTPLCIVHQYNVHESLYIYPRVLRHGSCNFTRRNIRLRFNGKQKNNMDIPVCLESKKVVFKSKKGYDVRKKRTNNWTQDTSLLQH